MGQKTFAPVDFDWFNFGIYKPFIALGGQRAELCIVPEWILEWQQFGTDALWDWMLLHADRAAESSFHLTKANGEPEMLSENPAFYYYGGCWLGKTEKGIIINPELGSNGMAHQGWYFYVPYAVTGDPFLLEELKHHAIFGVRNQPQYLNARGGGDGWLFGMANGPWPGAWAATKIAEALFLLPDDETAWRAEFERIVANNDTREQYYESLEPDTVIGHSIMGHERLLAGNTTEVVNPPDRPGAVP